jgi:EAL domain-containing protein (putative c-di-GMP-specific phosphodiesterase class I)
MFDAHRNAQQLQRYELSAQLPEALRRDEFHLLYQPLVTLHDNTVRGVEALLRWSHPQLGTVAPAKFVPIAEHTGLIVPLGHWVLRQACAQAARWHTQLEQPPFVSVNVSMRQCADPRFVNDVTAALADNNLPPTSLQLELTETAVMLPSDTTISTLRMLADLGVRIAIDDFGIGYSNLAHLRDLPIHGLKLAGAFMAGIRSPAIDHIDEQIVSTIVKLAHTLNLTVTAEGVETPQQAERVTALGCDLGQGWHYGAATTPDRIPHLSIPQPFAHATPN